MTSIFPTLALDRAQSRWEEHLLTTTPWEFQQGIWFKREDQFAPLGYGGPNGSKMRQLIWYVDRYRQDKERIVTGASVQSPQLSMTAIVGAHYGLPVVEVMCSLPNSVMRHSQPAIAAGFGATFDFVRGPYNPIIQRRVKQFETNATLTVPYGISMPIAQFSTKEVRAFHETGARQVENIPPQVRRLIVPAGSCNTLCSVLLGLQTYDHNVEELFTIGIGPDKMDWVGERMAHMGLPDTLGPSVPRWRHYSLHDNKYSTYDQKFKGERFRGINFHPTYEAKMWRWLKENHELRFDGSDGFWIVGAEAKREVVEPFYTHREAVL